MLPAGVELDDFCTPFSNRFNPLEIASSTLSLDRLQQMHELGIVQVEGLLVEAPLPDMALQLGVDELALEVYIP